MDFSNILSNPFAFFTALAAGGAMFMGIIRYIPIVLVNLRTAFTTQLVIYSADYKAYTMLSNFLMKPENSKRARSLFVNPHYDRVSDKVELRLVLGEGLHILRACGHFYFISRQVSTDKNGFGRQETVRITTLWKSQKAINKLLNKINVFETEDNCIPVYSWQKNSYELLSYTYKRPLNTIFIPDNQKNRLVDDIETFLTTRESYLARGMPYRRGYMIDGKPGVGKSSIILALASHFDLPIYIVNLSTVADDNTMQRIFSQTASRSIVLLEDIDTQSISNKRETSVTKTEEDVNLKSSLTLSGLLNAIDGVIAGEGRLLFMTTNHKESLDPALIRPGRIDVSERFEYMELPEALAMFELFYPEEDATAFKKWIKPQIPIIPSNMANILIARGWDAIVETDIVVKMKQIQQ